ncbi:MAG: hypothetical protein HN904_27670 [Victivallales bacterium]|jgi:uncharacterized protein YxjI|nr:hypothetical protein [Victivallales bacterium]
MRYRMTQKLFAMGDDFTIADSLGNDVYLVDGKAFSFGKKLSFLDMDGKELAFIAQRLLSMRKTYEIHRAGQLFAEVRKEFSFFKDKYTVDIPGPNDYEVSGSFFDHEYSFSRCGRDVALVSKTYFTWADSYGIDIVDGQDDITILATAVCIDLVNQASRH